MVGISGHAGAAMAFAILLAGCGHGSDAKNESEMTTMEITTAEVVSGTPTATDVNGNGTPDADPADQDWPGTMTVVLEDATSPEAVRGREFMEGNNLLQQLADDINQTLKLPYDITLKASECGEPNDYWSTSERSITMCYEDATNALDVFTKLGDADPEQSAFDTEMEAFYHESGHMVVNIYDLPATGRKEDVADQASTYLLLRPVDGKIDAASINAVKNTARLYKDSSEERGEVDDSALADAHTPDRARMYNFECWAYGADPDQAADLVTDGLLPEDRAEGCQDEYEKLAHAWDTLLGPYLRT